jgi:hypothetical protein
MRAGGRDVDMGAAEPRDRVTVEPSAATPSLSSARERASIPSAQSVPLARVVSVSRPSASAASSGLPTWAAATISSAGFQLELARSAECSLAWSAAASASSERPRPL